jgi:hypothetical protein
MEERFESDSGTGGGGEGLSDDALGSFVSGHTPWFPLEADLRVPEDVCQKKLVSPQLVGLPLAGEGAQLRGGSDLKVGEAQGGLEGDGGEPDPNRPLNVHVDTQGIPILTHRNMALIRGRRHAERAISRRNGAGPVSRIDSRKPISHSSSGVDLI